MLNFKIITSVATVLSLAPAAWASTVYVESNLAESNSLLAFDLSRSGQLTEKGSIPTLGKGIVDPSLALGPFDSDQEVIFNADKTLLFAVNSGSNTIAVFHVAPGGALTPVHGSPFNSHGINPVSLGLKGHILTVVNKHEDPAQSGSGTLPNYTTFEVAKNGELAWSGFAVDGPQGSSPSQALISPLEPLVFGADFLGGLVRSFTLDKKGAIQSVSNLTLPDSSFPDPKTPRFPLGLAAHPQKPLIYVGYPTGNQIGVYSYEWNGKLQFENAVKDSGAVVCWLITDRSGKRLYASNTADASITVYDIGANPRNPRELQKISLPTKGGAYQLALSPDENHLIVVTQRFQTSTPIGEGNEIHVLNLEKNTGTLKIAPGSPHKIAVPGATRPQGIAIY